MRTLVLLTILSLVPALGTGGRASAQSDPEVGNLVAVLRNASSDSMAKMSACRALGRMGARAKRAVPAIMLVLRDQDKDTRDAAITALYRIGPDSQPAIPALEEVAASDPDPLLRSLAQSAIRIIRGEEPGPGARRSTSVPKSMEPTPLSPDEGPAMPPAPRTTTARRKPAPADARRALPQGFTSRPAGSGQMLSAQVGAERGSEALGQAFDALTNYFDQRPRAVRAIETVDGKGIQVLFTTSLQQQPLRGFATAENGEVKIVYDRADRFGQAMTALSREAGPATQARRPRQVPLHPVRFSTGTINLPDGWNITGQQMGVEASGPEGGIAFGYAFQAYTPQYAAQLGMRPPVVAEYGDAARTISQAFAPMGLMRDVRVIERSPSQGWDGPAEYLHFTADYLGKPSEIFALVLQKPLGPGTFFVYYSMAYTAVGQFERNFPVLMQIWQSWKTDDRVFQQRLQSAIENMNECHRIVQGVIARREGAMERSNMAWDHYIRGTWPVEDTATGRRGDFYQDINPTIRRLNEMEGYERWRPVPFDRLNRP